MQSSYVLGLALQRTALCILVVIVAPSQAASFYPGNITPCAGVLAENPDAPTGYLFLRIILLSLKKNIPNIHLKQQRSYIYGLTAALADVSLHVYFSKLVLFIFQKSFET